MTPPLRAPATPRAPRARLSRITAAALLCVASGYACTGGGGPALLTPERSPGSLAGNRPELVLQAGHSDQILALAFTPSGRHLVTGSRDSSVRLWEVKIGRELRSLSDHSGAVFAIARSPDGRFLASASNDGAVSIRDPDTGVESRRLRGHSTAVHSLAFAPDGRWLASGGDDNTIRLWDPVTGVMLRALKPPDPPTSGGAWFILAVAVSPDGRLLASAGLDYRIRLWDPETGREIRILLGHEAAVTALGFSPDGRWLASGGEEVRLWDVRTGRMVKTLPDSARNLAFSPDGRWLATIGSGGVVRVWDPSTGSIARSLPDFGRATAIGFSRDGRLLAAAESSHSIRLWETSTWTEAATFGGHAGRVSAIAFSPDGRWLAAAGSHRPRSSARDARDTRIRLWETRTEPAIRTVTAHRESVMSLAFSPDGQTLASGSQDGTIALSAVDSGELRRRLLGHKGAVVALAFSSDGQTLASGSQDGTVRLWGSGSRPSRLLAQRLPTPSSLAFSPDGRWLAGAGLAKGGHRVVRLWDLWPGGGPRTLEGHAAAVIAVAFSPDGRLLASSDAGGTIRLWDARTWREHRTLSGLGAGVALVFAPDGRWLASAGRVIGIWEVASGQLARVLTGHTAAVGTLAFTPDGRFLASGSDDGSVRLWNPGTGADIALLASMRESDEWVAVTAEGLFDGSASGMQTLVAWRIGNRTYPPDRFFADYYTPGLLTRLFRGEHPRPAAPLGTLKLPPEVRIASPGPDSRLAEEQLGVEVEVTDQGGGVAEVRLAQNGKVVASHPGRAGPSARYSFTVDLVSGENLIAATALSLDRVESTEDTVRVHLQAPAPARPALHVLSIGINAYEDPAFDLGFARPDAEAIARFFEQRGRRLFGVPNVTTLLDREATRARLRQALDDLAGQARPEDLVVIYLAGHGVGLGQQFYFLPHEMRREPDTDAAVRKYGVPATELGDALRRVRALKQVLLLDTCQSETALPILAKLAVLRGLGAAEDKALKMLARAHGVHLIAASTRQQYAFEVPELGHGVLTYALLSGLGEKGPPQAPTTPDGLVTIHALVQYVNQRVPELTEKHHDGQKQYPVSFNAGMDFPLALR